MARRYPDNPYDEEDPPWTPDPYQPDPNFTPGPEYTLPKTTRGSDYYGEPYDETAPEIPGGPSIPPVLGQPLQQQPNRNSGGGGGSTATTASFFAYPEFTPPSFDIGSWAPPSWDVVPFAPPGIYPEYAAPEAFNFPAFEGPTAENFETDPGYEFRAKEMERRVANDASARGLRSSGGYTKDLASYLGGLASQEFGNVYGRQQGAWRDNRTNALDIYNINEGNRFKTWEAGRGRNLDELARETARYQANFNDEATEFDRAHLGYLTNYNREADEYNRALSTYGTNFGTATGTAGLNLQAELGRGGLALNQKNSNFGNLLSLYDLSTRNLPRYTPTTMPPV